MFTGRLNATAGMEAFRNFTGSRTTNAAGRRALLGGFALFLLLMGSAAGGLAQSAHYSGTQTTVISSNLSAPEGVAVDQNLNLFIADSGNNQVKEWAWTGYGYSGPTVLFGGADGAPRQICVGTADMGSDTTFEYVGVTNFDYGRLLYYGWFYGTFASMYGKPKITLLNGQLDHPFGIAADANNWYVTQEGQLLAYDTGWYTYSSIDDAYGLAEDSGGSLYVGQPNRQQIVRVDPDKSQYVVATGVVPAGLAVDSSGNVYAAENGNNRVIKIPALGGLYGPRQILAVGLSSPTGVATDTAGNVYVADTNANRILKLNFDPINFGKVNVSSKSSTVSVSFTFDVAGSLNSTTPYGVLTQGATGLDFTDAGTGTCVADHTYNEGDTCTVDVIFAPTTAGLREGAVVLYDTSSPKRVSGTIYFSGVGVAPVVAYSPYTVTVVAGTGTQCGSSSGVCGDGGLATSAQLSDARGVTVDSAGNLYIADRADNRVRKVDAGTGMISTVAGTGAYTQSGDGGAATSAGIMRPWDVAVDGAGNFYISDIDDDSPYYSRVREVDAASGLIHTYAGVGTHCPGSNQTCGDGAAASIAKLWLPRGLAVDGLGNLYFADQYMNKIRRVDAITGIITTIAGQEAGTGGFSGDLGLATNALLSWPAGVAVASSGDIYIADTYNHRIRMIQAGTGIIFTMAGNGTQGFNGDGIVCTSAELDTPIAVAVDAAGNFYIADRGNNRVRMVSFSTGTISTLASGLNNINGIAVDGAGNVYVSESGNFRVLKIARATAPAFQFANTNEQASSAAQDATIQNIGNAQLDITEISTPTNFSLSGADTTCASNEQSLAPGESCVLGIEFAPKVFGSLSDNIFLADNALGQSFAWQSIMVSGTGIAVPTQLAFTAAPPSTAKLGDHVGAVTVAVEDFKGRVITSSTATINLSIVTPSGGTHSLNASASSGAATFNMPALTLIEQGAYTFTATSSSLTSAVATVYSQITPTISWNTPAPISYGTALSGAQLNASSAVAGSFTYTPAAGTVLTAGPQTLSVTFTPTDSTDYTAVTQTVTLTVNKATPSVTAWPTASSITYGQTLASSTLSGGTSTPAGSFAFTTPTTAPSAGTASQSVTFTPTDATDYSTLTGTATVSVTKTTQTITFPAITGTQVATTTIGLSASATSGLPVSFASTTPAVCTVTGSSAALLASGTCSLTATQAGNSSYNAATPVGHSFWVSHAAQTITFPAIATQVAETSVTLAATASSGLTVSYTSLTPTICTVSAGSALPIASGTCTIQASQAGNTAYSAATSVSHSFWVSHAPQTITFPAIATQVAETSVTLTATASSGLTVSYNSLTPTICTVSGSSASPIASGTCTIQASQAGNTAYSAATSVSHSFWVSHAPQTTTFPAIATQVVNASVTLAAKASSGLAVSYTSLTPAVCTVTGSTASLLTIGTCTIKAAQAGNTAYVAATSVSVSFTVSALTQTITFPAITASEYAATTLGLTASASSGLTVSYTSLTPAVCTVAASSASLIASGTCTIQASQAGNTAYSAAMSVNHSFWVSHAPQTITFPAIATQVIETSVTLKATASSGLALSYTSLTPAVCTVTGSTASLLTIGTCTIKAAQAGNTAYVAATSVSVSFTVSGAAQTITFPAITASEYAVTTLGLTASASSGLTVSFISSTPTVCTVSGSTASLLTSGTCSLEAMQAGNSLYAAATPVYHSFWVSHATQTINFPAITGTSLAATASSGLPVSYTSLTPTVCTVAGSTISMISPVAYGGSCTIQASQAGNTIYSAATNVKQSFLGRYVAAGDSITWGCCATPMNGGTAFQSTNSWAPLLAAAHGYNLLDLGIGGPGVAKISEEFYGTASTVSGKGWINIGSLPLTFTNDGTVCTLLAGETDHGQQGSTNYPYDYWLSIYEDLLADCATPQKIIPTATTGGGWVASNLSNGIMSTTNGATYSTVIQGNTAYVSTMGTVANPLVVPSMAVSKGGGGSGYTNGDILSWSQGSSGCSGTATATVTGGVVTAVVPVLPQTGACSANAAYQNLATTGGTGTGALVNITALQVVSYLTISVDGGQAIAYAVPYIDNINGATWYSSLIRIPNLPGSAAASHTIKITASVSYGDPVYINWVAGNYGQASSALAPVAIALTQYQTTTLSGSLLTRVNGYVDQAVSALGSSDGLNVIKADVASACVDASGNLLCNLGGGGVHPDNAGSVIIETVVNQALNNFILSRN